MVVFSFLASESLKIDTYRIQCILIGWTWTSVPVNLKIISENLNFGYVNNRLPYIFNFSWQLNDCNPLFLLVINFL